MTDPRIIEILNLINDQNTKLIDLVDAQAKELMKIESAIKISLSQGFLENAEITIYSHLSMMDDILSNITKLNENIISYLKPASTIG
jgi:hypothetical protein